MKNNAETGLTVQADGKPAVAVVHKLNAMPNARTVSTAKELRELYGWTITDKDFDQAFGLSSPFVAVPLPMRAAKYPNSPGHPITLTDQQLREWKAGR
jgi:hypothetical protein